MTTRPKRGVTTITLCAAVREMARHRVEELGYPYTFSAYLAKLVEADCRLKLVRNDVDEERLKE